jgi:hypothetical protein
MTDKNPLAPSDNPDKAPKPSSGDVAYTLAKAGLSAIPVVGGPIAELVQLVLQPPLERRRHIWFEELAARLRALEIRQISLESLQTNEQFISATLQATLIAMRTHQEEKLRALRNALFNIATGHGPDETLQSIFLNMIDAFTDWHIKILRLFQHPTAHGAMTQLYEVLEWAYPELAGRNEVYDTIWNELSSLQLVNIRFLHGALGGMDSLITKRTTELGDLLLGFIGESTGPPAGSISPTVTPAAPG